MSASKYEVSIASAISQDLALRDIAGGFFNDLERRREDRIVVDFSGVKTISRSFAHEYQTRKKCSSKAVIEVNVPDNVGKMFIAALDYRKDPRFPDLAKEPFIEL